MSNFHLQILTPDIIRFDGFVERVRVRTNSGDASILNGHIQYISVIPISIGTVVIDGISKEFTINTGVIHVKKDKVIIFSRASEFLEDLDLPRAIAKVAKVEKKIPNLEGRDLKRQEASLARAKNRVRLAESTGETR